MKHIFLFCIILLISLNLFGQIDSSSERMRIISDTAHYKVWDSKDTLQWKDFTIVEKLIDNYYGAETYCQLLPDTLFSSNSVLIFIYSIFNKDTSYVFKDVLTNTYDIRFISSKELLFHEQGHFDILEIAARIIRKHCVTKINASDDKYTVLKKMFNAYKKGVREFMKLSYKYDKKTDHGLFPVIQYKWHLKIKKKLEKLEDYANPIVEIKLN